MGDVESGKTTTTTTPKYRLHLVSDETQGVRREAYDLSQTLAHERSANAAEKDARAAVYAAVKRVLSPRDVVVLDGLNYIKGWRYQLYCEAKNLATPSVLLQVGCMRDKARQVNEDRLRRREERREKRTTKAAGGEETKGAPASKDVLVDSLTTGPDDDDDQEPYERENWENLVFRYEEPNPMTRWDSPLFTLVWEDDEAQTKQVFDGIWDAIAGEGRKPIKPHQAAVHRDKFHGEDYLYALERETQEVVKRILDQQPDEGGGEVKIPIGRGNDEGLTVELPGRKVALPQLQRYRRAFIALNRGGIGLEAVGKFGGNRLKESFVGYLNDTFNKDET